MILVSFSSKSFFPLSLSDSVINCFFRSPGSELNQSNEVPEEEQEEAKKKKLKEIRKQMKEEEKQQKLQKKIEKEKAACLKKIPTPTSTTCSYLHILTVLLLNMLLHDPPAGGERGVKQPDRITPATNEV